MRALVPFSDGALARFLQGLADYDNQDSQIGLAQQILYGLGIDTAQNVPNIAEGESLPDYMKRLEPNELATIEGLGIGQGQQLQEYFRIAARLILYEQYITGRWQEYADELGINMERPTAWSSYVTHLLDDCLKTSEAEGRRWAVALEVIARLYRSGAKEQFGLVYIGDPVIDNETGEIVADVTQGLPPTPEEMIRDKFTRYSREAGVRLRDLLRTPEDEGAVQEVRRILHLATDSTLDDKQVNRQATGGKSLMPAWVLPEGTPPAWASFLESQFPEAVSGTGSLGMGQRYVQVRSIVWPGCKHCGELLAIDPDYLTCIYDGCKCCLKPATVDGRIHGTLWATRVADEHGRYPMEWTLGAKPTEWIEGIAPETMDIHGLKVSVWEITVRLEELDAAIQ
jgi:hypothetical protein